ncbi:MAG: hypothetical protein ACO3F3_15045 [Gemmataceae bacterium]
MVRLDLDTAVVAVAVLCQALEQALEHKGPEQLEVRAGKVLSPEEGEVVAAHPITDITQAKEVLEVLELSVFGLGK